ncbi:MAG: hypothetical protein ACJ763_09895 [Bdellovibrionia bacterium]
MSATSIHAQFVFYDLCLDFPTPTQGAGGPAWIVFLAMQNHFTQPKLFVLAALCVESSEADRGSSRS